MRIIVEETVKTVYEVDDKFKGLYNGNRNDLQDEIMNYLRTTQDGDIIEDYVNIIYDEEYVPLIVF